jgi:hypothetical protein
MSIKMGLSMRVGVEKGHMEQIFEWSNLAYFPLYSNAMVNNFFLAANCPYSAK